MSDDAPSSRVELFLTVDSRKAMRLLLVLLGPPERPGFARVADMSSDDTFCSDHRHTWKRITHELSYRIRYATAL